MDPDEQALREHFEASNAGDFDRAARYYDRYVVLVDDAEVTMAPGAHYGYRAVNGWFADWLLTFEGGVRFEDLRIEHGRNALAATARQVARGSGGLEMVGQNYWAYWFRKGKIIRVELHKSMDDLRAAAGVP